MTQRSSTTLMRELLPRPALLALSGLVFAAAGLWLAPGSPVTLWRADSSVANQVPVAVALYDDVGHHGWTNGLRRTALSRAAVLLSTDLDRPAEARARLEMLSDIEDEPAARAVLRERIGQLYLAEGVHGEAAREFLAAYSVHPSSPKAARRLIRAARTFTDAGEHEVADNLWQRLYDEQPYQRAVARLAQARHALSEGNVEHALVLFDEARSQARTPDQEAAARLGAATALERLGSLEEAIAEFDGAELPGTVRERRLDGLRARQVVRDR